MKIHDNPSSAEVRIVDTAVGVLGEKSRYPLTDQIAFPATIEPFPPRTVGSAPLVFKRAAMPPEHYTGFLYLPPEGAEEKIAIPVDVNMRTGPLGPLVAILIDASNNLCNSSSSC